LESIFIEFHSCCEIEDHCAPDIESFSTFCEKFSPSFYCFEGRI